MVERGPPRRGPAAGSPSTRCWCRSPRGSFERGRGGGPPRPSCARSAGGRPPPVGRDLSTGLAAGGRRLRPCGSPRLRSHHARVLPPPLPHPVLAARRGGPDRPADRARGGDGAPGGRDHGPRESARRPGVLHQGPARRRAADHRVRVLRHAERHDRQGRPDALPPGAAGQEPDRVQEPDQALVDELHRRVLLQAADRPRRAQAVQRGARRDDVLLAGRGPADHPEKGRGRGRGGLPRLPRHLRRRLLHRGPGPRHPRPADVQRGPDEVGRQVRRPSGGEQRRPLRGPARR